MPNALSRLLWQQLTELAKIEAFKKRMGWSFKWLSSSQNDFNYDYQASFTPEAIQSGTVFYNYANQKMNMSDREGVSIFHKDANGAIYHTYSAYARGIDMLNTAYHYLDLTPKGRDEGDSPQSWVRFHDRYKDERVSRGRADGIDFHPS